MRRHEGSASACAWLAVTAQLAAVLAAAAVVLLALSRWLRSTSGLPDGRIAYDDSGTDAPVLHSEDHGLTGKPDYLLRTGRRVVPVEVKPTRRDGRTYRSDILQLAAYCLLTEESQESFGGYGIVRAGGVSKRIAFSPELRLELLSTLDEMRRLTDANEVAANHNSPARCRSCACLESCGSPVVDRATFRGHA